MSNMSDHKMRKHSDVKLPCESCGKSFGTTKDLWTHNKRVHEKSELNIKGKVVTKIEFNESLFKDEVST